MSRRSNREVLYKEYVSAVRACDDKEVYIVLKKITEVDPSDANARKRCRDVGEKVIKNLLDKLGKTDEHDERRQILSELETLFPVSELSRYKEYLQYAEHAHEGNSDTKNVELRDDEHTRELYRRLREAMLSRRQEDAFNILEEICKINPNDTTAQRQKQGIGDFLCNQHADEMVRLGRVGDIPALCNLVACMRRWACASSPEQINGFHEAAALVDRLLRQDAERRVAHDLATLRSDAQLSTNTRYKGVCEIERIIAKHGIALQAEDVEFMNRVKKEWSDEKSANKRAQILEGLGTCFDDLQNAVGPIVSASTAALFEQVPLLEELLRQINYIGEYPEVEELSGRVSRKLVRIRNQIQHRRTMRNVKIFISLLVLAITLCVAGALCLANFPARTDVKQGKSGLGLGGSQDTSVKAKQIVSQEKTENSELEEQPESPDQRETRGNRTPSVTPESDDDQDLVTKMGSGSNQNPSKQPASGDGYGSLVNLETDDYQKPSGRSESGSSHGASAVSNRSEDTEHWVLKDGDKGVKIKTVVEEKEEKYRVGVTVTLSSDLPAKEKFKGWNYYYIEMDGGEPKEWTDEGIQLTKFWDVSFNGAEILPKYKIADIRSKLEEKLKVAEQELRKAIKGVGKFKKPKWGDVEKEFKEWEKVKSEEKKKKKEVAFGEKMVKKIEEFLSSEGVELEDDEGDESEDEEDEEESWGDGGCTDKGDDSGKDKNKGSEKNKGKGKKETYQSALQRLCDATKGYGGALNRLSKENVAHLIRRTKGKAKEYLKQRYGKDVRVELSVKEKTDTIEFVTFSAEIKIRSESHE